MTKIQVGHGDKNWSNLGRLRIDIQSSWRQPQVKGHPKYIRLHSVRHVTPGVNHPWPKPGKLDGPIKPAYATQDNEALLIWI